MDKKKFTINLDDSAFTTERPQVKSLFKASSRSDEPPAQAAQPPLSYAEFIIQRKGQAAQSSDAGAQVIGEQGSSAKQATHSETADAGVGVHQPAAAPAEAQGEAARSDAALSSGPKAAGTGSSIIVSPRQRGNPILKFVRSVPWEFGEVAPDYILGPTTCALFLSLRYHNLHPNYIHDRLKNLGQTFTLRVLLVQVDVKDPHHALKELARICIMADCTLILAWSPEEAGRYLETYKAYEKKPADLLKEQVEKDFLSKCQSLPNPDVCEELIHLPVLNFPEEPSRGINKVTDCLTTVKSINRTDAITLLSTFSSLEGVMNASKEDLALCPGLGPQKARRLYDVLHQPFLKSKRKAET